MVGGMVTTGGWPPGMIHAALHAVRLDCLVATEDPETMREILPLSPYRITDLSAGWDNVEPPGEPS